MYIFCTLYFYETQSNVTFYIGKGPIVHLQGLQDAHSNPNVVRRCVCVYVCTLKFPVNLFEIAITRKVWGGLWRNLVGSRGVKAS